MRLDHAGTCPLPGSFFASVCNSTYADIGMDATQSHFAQLPPDPMTFLYQGEFVGRSLSEGPVSATSAGLVRTPGVDRGCGEDPRRLRAEAEGDLLTARALVADHAKSTRVQGADVVMKSICRTYRELVQA